MKEYQGIIIAKDVHFGVVPVFYSAEYKTSYERDTVIGRLADDERHEVLESIWLDKAADYGSAQKIADRMMAGVSEVHESAKTGKYEFSRN